MGELQRPIDPIALALLMMFGSLLAGMLVGALVGRFTRFEAGAAVALFALAVGGLGGAVRVWWYFAHESALVNLVRSGCVEWPYEGRRASMLSADRYGLVLRDGRGVTLQTPDRSGACGAADPQPVVLRYRLADIAPGAPALAAAEIESDPRAPQIGPLVFVAFGSFGLLGALVMLASVRSDRRRERLGPAADAAPAVSALRRRIAGGLNAAGTLTVLIAAVAAGYFDDSAERSTVLVFGAVTVACVCYALAFAARGTLRLEAALILLIIGGGFAAAAWSLAALG